MADDKQTKLSIVIRTVDKATARIKAINDRLEAVTKPVRDFKKALGDLYEKSGLAGVVGGFKDVGNAITGLLAKVGAIGGIAGVAVAGLFHLVDGFDELGDKAESIGVSVDFLAQMRYAAERSGAAVESLDGGLQGFSKSLGQARAGTGRMAAFLTKVSPALLKQLKAAKSNEAAFDLLAGAMAKLEDPAKKAALAQATLGDAALAPLFAKGPKGIKELRDRYLELAGSQKGAAEEAGKVDDSLKDLHASTDGIKAAIVQGLAPALKIIVDRLRDWFVGHRADIAEWAKQIGEKLPGAIKAVAEWIGMAFDKVSAFVERIGGLKNAAIGAAAIMAGPLIGSIVSLSGALLTALSRAVQLGKAIAGIPAVPNAGGGGGGAAGAAAQAAQGAMGTTQKVGLLGVLSTAAPWVALGIGLHQAGEAAGLNHEGLQSKIMGLQQQAQRHEALKALGRTEMTDEVFRGIDRGRSAASDLGAQANAALAAAPASAPPAQAKVTIDLNNAPRGTRVRTDPQSTADVDLSVGYQMGLTP